MTEAHHDAAIGQLRSLYPELDGWRPLLVTGSWQPDEGSELAADDLGWPPSPLSQLSKASLGSAWDHLSAVRAQVELSGVFPFATHTLLRTAIVAGAQTVWLLGDESPVVRQARGRTLTAETYRRHAEYLNELLKFAGAADPNTASVAEFVAGRIRELSEVRATRGEKAEWNATGMIEWATAATFSSQENIEELIVEARSEFRRGSGAAHGLLWSILGRADNAVESSGDDGLVSITASGSVDAILNPFMLAFHLSRNGWNLLNKRSRASGSDEG